jgi:hypothetical protein
MPVLGIILQKWAYFKVVLRAADTTVHLTSKASLEEYDTARQDDAEQRRGVR